MHTYSPLGEVAQLLKWSSSQICMTALLNREETLKTILNKTEFLCFRVLSVLIDSKCAYVDKMPPVYPGPTQTSITIFEGHQGIACNIFLFHFLFTPSFPLALERFHLPLSLEHCLTVYLFSLCMLSLPPLFTFVSRLLFLFNSPWCSLFFSVPLIFSAALLFPSLTFHPKMLLGPCFQLGLFCLVYWTFPLPHVTQKPPFFCLFLLFLPAPPLSHLIRRQEATSSFSLSLVSFM